MPSEAIESDLFAPDPLRVAAAVDAAAVRPAAGVAETTAMAPVPKAWTDRAGGGSWWARG
jgi:hypothetical protein